MNNTNYFYNKELIIRYISTSIILFVCVFLISNIAYADKWPRFQFVNASGEKVLGTTNKIIINNNKITFYNHSTGSREEIDYIGINIYTKEGELTLDNNNIPIFTIDFYEVENHPANGKKFYIGTKTQNGWIISKEDIDRISKETGIYNLIKNNL